MFFVAGIARILYFLLYSKNFISIISPIFTSLLDFTIAPFILTNLCEIKSCAMLRLFMILVASKNLSIRKIYPCNLWIFLCVVIKLVFILVNYADKLRFAI